MAVGQGSNAKNEECRLVGSGSLDRQTGHLQMVGFFVSSLTSNTPDESPMCPTPALDVGHIYNKSLKNICFIVGLVGPEGLEPPTRPL